jgi:Uma2 family endonuclease
MPTSAPAAAFGVCPLPVGKFTVAEYHRLIDGGFFAPDERFELLEGWIVPKLTRRPPHDVVIDLTAEALRACLPAGLRVRIQSAVTFSDSEPEPDVAVVRGRARDYVAGHPGPADIELIIEVADSSLQEDRKAKGRLYARAGVRVYWIVNLVDECVEVHSGPSRAGRYRRRRVFPRGRSVPVVVAGRELAAVAVADLLP